MSRPDGGPAFPAPEAQAETVSEHRNNARGMTLRDYFAAKAMQAALRNNQGAMPGDVPFPDIASGAYAMADAMLAERSKP